MRKFSCLSAALVAAFSFGALGCDDDSGTPADTSSPDTSTPDTTTPDTSTPDTSTPDTTPEETDTTPTDPCDPNPCTTAPGPSCDAEGKVVTYTAPGTCTNEDGQAACDYDSAVTECGAGEVCSAGTCLTAGSVCDYEYDARVSYVTEIAVGNQGGADTTCCFDYNGDDTPDNSLGDLLKTAGTLLGLDVNATIAEQIAGGTLVLLLETKGVEDATNDDSFDISGFYGDDADEDAANNAAGTSAFTVDPSSFQSGTSIPLISFPGATITAGQMAAGPNLFQLSLPIVGAQLDIAVSETRLEGDVAVGPNGQGLAIGADGNGAKLGGVIKEKDLYAALNAFVASCTCVEFTNPADTVLIGEDGQCNAAKTDKCTAADGDACKQLPPLCGTLLAFIDSDVDTDCLVSGSYNEADCDGENDAVSIGVWARATSGTIAGTQTCVETE